MIPTIKQIKFERTILPKRKRVATYARVSTGKKSMLESLYTQISYYNELIQNELTWQYVGVYADEATTGTKDNRIEFKRLLGDCKNGKIDMIITKSISRFARNSVLLLETVRKLKEYNVDVYFEEQNIHSISADGELMLTILASYAQEESFSVSENCKWRIRKKFQEGIPSYTQIFGYEFVNDQFQIIPAEAEIVRMIFEDYLSGMGKNAIARKLRDMGIKGKRGGDWSEKVISRMLENKKYCGNLILQKTYLENHITKKKCFNIGQIDKYAVTGSHEAIIDNKTFEMVQLEIAKRAKKINMSSKEKIIYPFTGKIICEQCGHNYRRKITASGTKYEKAVWICSTYNTKGKKYCPSQQIPEEIIIEIVPDNFVQIKVPKPYTVTILLDDGTEITKEWQHKSRKESWTEDMKRQARIKSLKRRFE